VWLHEFQRLFEIRDVSVTVVQVVNNANMSGVVMRSKMLAHRHEIRRFATPAAMVIEAKCTTKLPCALHQRQHRPGRCFNTGLLCGCIRVAQRVPNLRMYLVLLKQPKGILVHAPKGEELKPVLFVLKNFLFKIFHMFRAPIVGHALEAEPHQHLRSLNRPSLPGVKWHDAPRNEPIPVKVVAISATQECEENTNYRQDLFHRLIMLSISSASIGIFAIRFIGPSLVTTISSSSRMPNPSSGR